MILIMIGFILGILAAIFDAITVSHHSGNLIIGGAAGYCIIIALAILKRLL